MSGYYLENMLYELGLVKNRDSKLFDEIIRASNLGYKHNLYMCLTKGLHIDINSLPPYLKLKLLVFDVYEYKSKIQLSSLRDIDLILLYVKFGVGILPELATLISWHKLGKDSVEFLFNHDKDIVAKYNLSPRQFSFSVWKELVKNTDLWWGLFLDHLQTLKNKTDVRSVFYAQPRLIELMTEDYIQNSHLTAKEWVLLSHRLTKHSVSLPKQTQDYLENKLMCDVLTGTSKTSIFTKKALKDFDEPDEPEAPTESDDMGGLNGIDL